MKSTVQDLQGRICPPGMKNSYRQKGQSRRSCLWRREETSCSQTCALNIWYAWRMLLLVASHSLRAPSKGTGSPCGLGSGSAWQKGVVLGAWGSDRNNEDWQERCSLTPFCYHPVSPQRVRPKHSQGQHLTEGFSCGNPGQQSVDELESPPCAECSTEKTEFHFCQTQVCLSVLRERMPGK